MKENRKEQLTSAQSGYRKRRKNEGFSRLQVWLSKEDMQNLSDLKGTLGLTQAEILALAIAKLREELQTCNNEVCI